jgi:hypothetical protein
MFIPAGAWPVAIVGELSESGLDFSHKHFKTALLKLTAFDDQVRHFVIR